MKKTPQYYREVLANLENRTKKMLNSASPLAKRIAYIFQEELIPEELDKYLEDNKDDFQKLPSDVTVKHLIQKAIYNLDFNPREIDHLVFLGMIVEQIEKFVKIFLEFGLDNKKHKDTVLSTKWNKEIQAAVDEIFDRESLITVFSYLNDMRKQCNFNEDVQDWKYPSLAPYAIKSMFIGEKLGDCVVKFLSSEDKR